jgi:prepilin-type processing-associated H-X9-DG protein
MLGPPADSFHDRHGEGEGQGQHPDRAIDAPEPDEFTVERHGSRRRQVAYWDGCAGQP